MTTDREKIEDVLDKGQMILLSQPELANMDLRDVINKLDDGTPEMIRNRWGVAAWIVVKSITDFNVQSLVEQLSNIESGALTYEYTGYLLLTRYEVNLEDLLLCAEKCNKFEKIVHFVCENIVYETKFYEENILPTICMMGNHLEHRSYRPFMWNYAKHITKFRAQKLVEEKIGDISGQAQYDLMDNLCADWYADNVVEATSVLERLLDRKGVWNQKLAIRFLDVSLHFDESIFQDLFERVEDMILADNQLQIIIVPLFVKYILHAKYFKGYNLDCTQSRVLVHLEKIPDGTLDEKYEFLNSILCQDNIPENLELIFNAILDQSFCKEQRFLNALDHHLYNYLQNGEWTYVLQLMKKVFIANQYSEDYEDFFHAFSSVAGEIRNYSTEVTCLALKDILSRDIRHLFFGLGVLMEYGDIQALIKKKKATDSALPFTLTSTQMIKLAKAILYFSVDTQKVCHTIFHLLEFPNDSNEQYIEFCLQEAFENYPATMYKVAKQYTAATEVSQMLLSQKIIHTYEQQLADRRQCYELKDLWPSREHDYIYRKALAEQNKKIQKQINEKSFFASLFPSRFLKYGVRNAHIMTGRKGEMIFQVSPYAHIQREVELPTLYVRDPIDFTLRRQAYLKEMVDSATHFEGLSDSIEREG